MPSTSLDGPKTTSYQLSTPAFAPGIGSGALALQRGWQLRSSDPDPPVAPG